MSCTNPKSAWHLLPEYREYLTELVQPLFKKPRDYWHYEKIKFSCTKCIGCKQGHTAIRSVQLHAEIQTAILPCYLLTTTYDEQHRPLNWSLNKEHPRLFFKRLRKQQKKDHQNESFKYVVKGEYGPTTFRPHYHVAAINLVLVDLEPYSDDGHFRSETLNNIWGMGTVDIIELNIVTAMYIQAHEYIKHGEKPTHQRFMFDSKTGEIIPDRIPPYINYSNGIGKEWYEKYGKTDLYNTDSIVINGQEYQIPKYFDKKLQTQNPELYEQIKQARKAKAKPLTPKQMAYQAKFNEVKQLQKRQRSL